MRRGCAGASLSMRDGLPCPRRYYRLFTDTRMPIPQGRLLHKYMLYYEVNKEIRCVMYLEATRIGRYAHLKSFVTSVGTSTPARRNIDFDRWL